LIKYSQVDKKEAAVNSALDKGDNPNVKMTDKDIADEVALVIE